MKSHWFYARIRPYNWIVCSSRMIVVQRRRFRSSKFADKYSLFLGCVCNNNWIIGLLQTCRFELEISSCFHLLLLRRWRKAGRTIDFRTFAFLVGLLESQGKHFPGFNRIQSKHRRGLGTREIRNLLWTSYLNQQRKEDINWFSSSPVG